MNPKLKKFCKRLYFFPGAVLNRFNFIIHGCNVGRNFEAVGMIRVFNRGGVLQIGDNCRIRSGEKANPIGVGSRTNFQINSKATISIGNHVKMSNVSISCQEKITIEDYVMLGGGVRIYDTDFHSLNPYIRMEVSDVKDVPTKKPIIIHRFAFIGAGSYILKGSEIGENSVIGAGSIVSGVIPPNQVWAGNPARYVRDLTGEEKQIENEKIKSIVCGIYDGG